MKKISRRSLALLLSAGLLLLAVGLPDGSARQPLGLAIGLWPGAETLILARERGLVPERSVQWVEMTWPSAAMRAFASGAVDAAVLSLDEVLRLREGGHKLRVVLVFDQSLTADAILARSAEMTVAALASARIGVDMRAAGRFLLAEALEKSGATVAGVTLVPLSQAEMAAALEDGKVDAVVAAEPWLRGLRNAGHHVLFEPKTAALPLLRVLVVSERALQTYRAEIAALVQAHFSLLPELARPGEVPGRLAVLRRERLNEASFLEALAGLQFKSQSDNVRLLMGKQSQLQGIGQQVAALLQRSEKLRSGLTSGVWLDASFVNLP